MNKWLLILLGVMTPVALVHADIYLRQDGTDDIHLSNQPVETGFELLVADSSTPMPPALAKVPDSTIALPYDRQVRQAAAATALEPALLHAVIHVESRHNPLARSGKGAQGLMQLMPATAKDLDVSDPYNPEQNTMAGARYLKSLLQLYSGDLSLALAAYNAGPQNVNRYGRRIPPFSETRDYVKRVMARYRG